MELEIGSVVEGKVTGITRFGAFVSLPGGRSGLVHISEIAWSYVNDVSEHLSEGQQVQVKIIGVDDNRRINLSIKQALPPPPRQERRPGPARREGGERRERGDRPPRPDAFNPKPQPKGPASFEDQLKQFMAASDSKLSQLHMNEKRGSRRGNGGGGRRG